MFNRSATIAASRAFTPLSPVFSSTLRVFSSTPTVELTFPSTPGSPQLSASFAAFRLDDASAQQLKSPGFSPALFGLSLTSPAPVHKTTAETPVLPEQSTTLRRKRVPNALPLAQPSRLSSASPLSPFRYGMLTARATKSPVSPSAYYSQLSPLPTISPLTANFIRQTKIDKLTRCLAQPTPQERVMPSIGQVTNVTSYLDLYRQGPAHSSTAKAFESKLLDLKSPAPKGAAAHRAWASIDEVTEVSPEEALARSTRRIVRRSRSAGALRPVPSPTPRRRNSDEGERPLSAARQAEVEAAIPEPIKSAKAAIVAADAERMAAFRTGFRKNRPAELRLDFLAPPSVAAPNAPLPSTPVPSALLAVQSPKAPYWVVLEGGGRAVKTPRTVMRERRQGWGGAWSLGSLGQMMNELKVM